MIPRFKQLAVPQHLDEPRQIRLFRSSSDATGWFGCPIGFQQGGQVPATPKRSPNDGEQALEAVIPSVHEFEAAHQQMDEQPCPYLPAYGIGAVAEKVGELERLLDFFKEHLDIPPAAVELRDRPRAPLQMVGQEDHFYILAVDLHEGYDAAQLARVGLLRFFEHQLDDFVAKDALVFGRFEGSYHRALHVVFRSPRPINAALRQLKEMLKLDVSLVEYNDFSGLKVGTQAQGLTAVMVFCSVDNGASRKEALQVQTHVALRGGLAAAVLCPVHAIGHQLYRGRIERMDRLTEAAKISTAHLALRKARHRVHQMLHHAPIEFFGHVRIAHLVRMAQVVARRRNRTADGGERSRIHLESIAHIVKSERMSKVGIQQRNHMAPWRVRPASGIDAMLLRKVRDHVSGNQIAQLLQGCIPMSGWFVFLSLFFHTLRVEDLELTSQPFYLKAMG